MEVLLYTGLNMCFGSSWELSHRVPTNVHLIPTSVHWPWHVVWELKGVASLRWLL